MLDANLFQLGFVQLEQAYGLGTPHWLHHATTGPMLVDRESAKSVRREPILE